MSRHRKVKGMNYHEDYDDVYGDYDDDFDDLDDDVEEGDFEAKYLNSAKKPVPKIQTKIEDEMKPARFEFTGKPDHHNSASTSAKSSNRVKIDEHQKPAKAKANKSNKSTNALSLFMASGQSRKSNLERKSAEKGAAEKVRQEQAKKEAPKVNPFQLTKQAQKYASLKQQQTRPRVNLIVVGHVDAGKSTLVGHLLFKLGRISGKQMHRYEVDSQRSGKSSFKFAWALDETDEERARGITVDLAFSQLETPNRDIVMVDAPGHVDFIPAVISGAAQADAAILVVDATRGEFETGFANGGQTREHSFLVRSLGAKSLVVAVNKMDNVDWSLERFGEIVGQLSPFFKQLGYNLKDDVQFVACSGLLGDNLIERRKWWAASKSTKSSHPQLLDPQLAPSSLELANTGSLLEAIDQVRPPERLVDRPTRFSVTDVFKGMGSGVHTSGRVVSGMVERRCRLLLMPANELCEVKQLRSADQEVEAAFAGDLVSLVASGLDGAKFFAGCVLCEPSQPVRATNRFEARIVMFQNAETILIKGSPIEVHLNGVHESGTLRKLISLLNKQTGELLQSRPRCVAKNASALVGLKLARLVCCEPYEDNRQLGRFMLRANGKTVAAGLITRLRSAKLERPTRMRRK